MSDEIPCAHMSHRPTHRNAHPEGESVVRAMPPNGSSLRAEVTSARAPFSSHQTSVVWGLGRASSGQTQPLVYQCQETISSIYVPCTRENRMRIENSLPLPCAPSAPLFVPTVWASGSSATAQRQDRTYSNELHCVAARDGRQILSVNN